MSLALSRLLRPFPNLPLSFPRRRESSERGAGLDSRFRGNDNGGGRRNDMAPAPSRPAMWESAETDENTRPSGGHSPWDG